MLMIYLMLRISSSDVNVFANDTGLHFSHNDLLIVEQTIQADIQNVSVWLVANKLKLNVAKSLCMFLIKELVESLSTCF